MRALRVAAIVAAGGLAVASIVALATDNLKGATGTGGIKVASGSYNPDTAVSGGVGSSQSGFAPATSQSQPIAAVLSPLASPSLAGGALGPLGANEPASTAAGGPSGATGAEGSSGGPGSPATPAPSAPAKVAIVSGVLSSFAFGSQVGLPLLCGVAVGGFGPLFTNPALTKVALTITSSCVTYGNQGATALTALNEKLSTLGAANPSVDPYIDRLASLFNTIGASGVPFATTLVEIGQMISFFQGS